MLKKIIQKIKNENEKNNEKREKIIQNAHEFGEKVIQEAETNIFQHRINEVTEFPVKYLFHSDDNTLIFAEGKVDEGLFEFEFEKDSSERKLKEKVELYMMPYRIIRTKLNEIHGKEKVRFFRCYTNFNKRMVFDFYIEEKMETFYIFSKSYESIEHETKNLVKKHQSKFSSEITGILGKNSVGEYIIDGYYVKEFLEANKGKPIILAVLEEEKDNVI